MALTMFLIMKKMLFVVLGCLSVAAAGAQNPGKFTPELAERLTQYPHATHSAFIWLSDHVDAAELLRELNAVNASLEQRGYEVVTRLQAKAEATQPALVERLKNTPGLRPESVQRVWATNAIFFEADQKALEAISAWPEVAEIGWNSPIEFERLATPTPSAPTPNGSEPGLRAIKAPFLWNLGYTGYGRKALVIDTGEDGDHPALRTNFWWHNAPKSQAWHGTGYPEDCSDHGTHVTGIVCGLDRVTNDTIGVAFNAHWIGGPGPNFTGCSTFNQTVFEVTVTMQWALNPDGNPNTVSDRPDAINCSFNSPSFSCNNNSTINLLNSLEAAGIAVIWSGGNNGPGANTVSSAAGLNMTLVNSFAVGAVNGANPNFPIASFSSRGPSLCGGSGALAIKPEVSAPGVNVRSSMPGNTYAGQDGTSMAAPHVAGAILLLKEAFPLLTGESLKTALYMSAIDLGAPGEDNAYGRGMINLEAAYDYIIGNGGVPATPVSFERDVILSNATVLGVCRGPVRPTITVKNGSPNAVTSVKVSYGVEGGTIYNFDWSGVLQPKAHANIELPPMTDVTPGEYTFIATISDPNGEPDARMLNNTFKHRFTMNDKDYPLASVTASQPEPVCANSRVMLEFTQTLEPGEVVQWFTTPTGLVPLAEDATFLTPPLINNTTYHVNTAFKHKVGKTDLNNTALSSGGGLRFNVFRPMLLRSVRIYAQETGSRVIRIVTPEGTNINTSVSVTQVGEQRVNINRLLQPGQGYQILLVGGKDLTQSNMPGYPHTVPGLVSIYIGQTPSGITTTGAYYYFFDWEVEEPQPCGRLAIPLTLSATQAPTVQIGMSADTIYLSQGGTLQLSDLTPDNVSQVWDFGNGTGSTETNPTVTYNQTGVYTITLQSTVASGCVNFGRRSVRVLQTTSTTPPDAIADLQFSLFPNPADQSLYLELSGAPTYRSLRIEIVDALGRPCLQTRLSDSSQPIVISALAAGAYALRLWIDDVPVGSSSFVKR